MVSKLVHRIAACEPEDSLEESHPAHELLSLSRIVHHLSHAGDHACGMVSSLGGLWTLSFMWELFRACVQALKGRLILVQGAADLFVCHACLLRRQG